ncbi:MAG: hypothetical protein AAF408_07065 [Pseudomonadota bacterium]
MQDDETFGPKFEKELVDRLEAQVRKRVMGYFLAIGALIGSVLGFFGYNVITFVEREAQTIASDAVKDIRGEVQAEVDPAVSQAQEAARQAGIQAERAKAKLEVLDDHLQRREAVLLTSQASTEQSRARVNVMQDDVDRIVQSLRDNLKGLHAQIAESQSQLKETNAQLVSLQDRSRDLAGVGNLHNLATGLEEITRQVQVLGRQISAIETALNLQPSGTETQVTRAVEQVLATAQQEKYDPDDRQDKPTVFVQFAVAPRSVIDKITAPLRQLGYNIPAAERVASAEGLHEVRYYYESDRDPARDLAAVLSTSLAREGFLSGIEIVDLTGFRGVRPRQGTVELWLEPRRP